MFTHDYSTVENHKNFRLINSELCGYNLRFKVFDGVKAHIYEFPWLALLAYRVNSHIEGAREFLCGGTLISSRYVLTGERNNF
jgi:secreted trypsin-like serine protease